MFSFVWVTREQSRREFGEILRQIEYNFRRSCNIGQNHYWTNFVRNTGISRVLMLYDHNEWTGFVAIKEGFQCFPDAKESGAAECTDTNPSWYIELICAHSDGGIKGRGTAMIEEVTKAAQRFGMRFITLSALPYVIMWYYQLGFRLTLDVACSEPSELEQLAQLMRDKLKRFRSDQEAFEDEDFVNFLRRAVAYGLGAKRLKYKNASTGCDSVNKPEDCAGDGIYMTLCIPEKTFEIQDQDRLDSFMNWVSTSTMPREEFQLPVGMDTD